MTTFFRDDLVKKQSSVAIVCESIHHGNTRKVADVASEALSASVYSVDEVKAGVTPELELIGFGSGIFFLRHHQSLLMLVDSWRIRGRGRVLLPRLGHRRASLAFGRNALCQLKHT